MVPVAFIFLASLAHRLALSYREPARLEPARLDGADGLWFRLTRYQDHEQVLGGLRSLAEGGDSQVLRPGLRSQPKPLRHWLSQ